MIDIHAHILPGIDDGAPDMNTALEMAAMAADSGVDCLVATPHCNIPGMYQNYYEERLLDRFREFQQEVEDARIPIQIFAGMEVFATESLPDLMKENRILGLNGTQYLLLEISFGEDPFFCDRILKECLAHGYMPVIAHPERYFFVQKHPEIVFDWYEQGYLLQVNKGSVLGRFGRHAENIAGLILDENIAACIASDAHSSWTRTTHMLEIQEYLQSNYGMQYAQKLLEENPEKILRGIEL